MYNRLDEMAARYRELSEQLLDPSVMSNNALYRTVLREHGRLHKIVPLYEELKKIESDLVEAESIVADPASDREIIELAESEIPGLTTRRDELTGKIRDFFVTDDKDAGRNAILEVRAGTGGDEAALFAAEIFRMYEKYAEKRRWKVEILDASRTGLGGLKEIVASVAGEDVYRRLGYESGGHRVQRVPRTETQGRIHTSAVTVAVLPEAEEVEVEIKDEDIKVDFYCASGPGGQHVNRTASAVRITHVPTGIIATCQDEKSQHKNRAKAFRILRSRVWAYIEAERKAEEENMRRTLIGSGDRSQRIRTYNFPQNRVTDHRINLTLYALRDVLEGGLDPVIDRLMEYDREQRIKSFSEVKK